MISGRKAVAVGKGTDSIPFLSDIPNDGLPMGYQSIEKGQREDIYDSPFRVPGPWNRSAV